VREAGKALGPSYIFAGKDGGIICWEGSWNK